MQPYMTTYIHTHIQNTHTYSNTHTDIQTYIHKVALLYTLAHTQSRLRNSSAQPRYSAKIK